ncbi:outer membrane protein assembly factor BamE [Marinomonas agarivorans]|nr:outer membrane protein assembly factor BamE [Marinomonas agarivorans]
MNKISIALIATFLVTGCSLFPSPYKVPVTQGTVLTIEQVNQLQIGMTTEQVTFLLGQPSIQDPLTPANWVYLFRSIHADKNTKISEVKKLTLVFDNKELIDIRKF